MKVRAASVVVVLASLLGCGPLNIPGEPGHRGYRCEDDPFDRLVYSVTEMEMGPADEVAVGRRGEARALVHGGSADAERPAVEIGVWRRRIPTVDLEDLRCLADSDRFRMLPDHWGRIAPDARVQRVLLSRRGDVVEKAIGEAEDVDRRTTRVLRRLAQVFAFVRERPQSVARLTVSEATVVGPRRVAVTMMIQALGHAPVELQDPRTLVEGQTGFVKVITWADGGEEVEAPPVSVALAEASQTVVIGSQDRPWLHLRPPARLEFVVTADVPGTSTGRHWLRVRYRAEETGERAPRGPLAADVRLQPVAFDL